MNTRDDEDFDQLLRAFSVIQQHRSKLKRRWALNRIAPYHGLPKAECRKLFELWVVESQTEE